uniref:LPXTG cell wall anchor domain-containing protein n=1 Tax=Rhabditophanes sp. KR3021 TaxID=114890 RepID=A0AC35TUD9_9BILA
MEDPYDFDAHLYECHPSSSEVSGCYNEEFTFSKSKDFTMKSRTSKKSKRNTQPGNTITNYGGTQTMLTISMLFIILILIGIFHFKRKQ